MLKEENLVFESYIVVDDKVKKKALDQENSEGRVKQSSPKDQQAKNDDTNLSVAASAIIDKFGAMPFTPGMPFSAGLMQLPVKTKKKENVVEYATDKDLDCLVILVNGIQGEQHKIFQFSIQHSKSKNTKSPFLAQNRAGNTFLEFNQDWHLREKENMFLIQTESNGVCTAKPLSWVSESEITPMIHLKNASKKLRKDVWIMNGYTDRLDEVSLQSIYKSSTDDFL